MLFNRNSFRIALLALKDKPVYKVNKTRVTIKWNEPDKTESLNESIFYDVECFLCKEKICNLTCGNVKFNPGNDNINTTLVVVTELTAGKSYKVRVYPKNNLNENILKNKWKFMETEQFTVYQSPSKNFLEIYGDDSYIGVDCLFEIYIYKCKSC